MKLYLGLFLMVLSFSAFKPLYIFSNYSYLMLINAKEPQGGPLSKAFLKYIKDVFKVNTFVETGTFLGKTTANAAAIFNQVYSIELSEELYNKAKMNLKNFSNVNLYLGDSAKVIPLLISKLPEKTLYWLDGHYSGVHFNQQTALGSKATPIIKELETILSSKNQAVILIDDIRLFDSTIYFSDQESSLLLGQYPSLDYINSLIQKLNPNYKTLLMGDILILYPVLLKVVPSKVLEACTISRFYNGENYSIYDILNAEEAIGKAAGGEKISLEYLYNWFQNPTCTKNNCIGLHYMLWQALISFHQKDFQKAKNILEHIINRPSKEWRFKWYYAQVAEKLGEFEKVLLYCKQVLDEVPHFKPAKDLLEASKRVRA